MGSIDNDDHDDDDDDDDDGDDDGDDDYITSEDSSKTGSRGSRPRLEPAQSFEKHENGPERGDTFGHQTIRLKMKAIKAQHYNMKTSIKRYSAAVLKKCDTPEDGDAGCHGFLGTGGTKFNSWGKVLTLFR